MDTVLYMSCCRHAEFCVFASITICSGSFICGQSCSAVQKFGGLRAMKKEIVFASVFVWGLVVVSGGVYVFAFWFWKLRLRNNMCIIRSIEQSLCI